MPLFEYRCRSCDASFEALVRNAARDRVTCESCDGENVSRLMGASAVQAQGRSLPIAAGACPPPEAGPCGTGCCRLPG